ncbi:hypothetical protein AKI39_21795 [Bordetella sp. H567]|uniref:nuclear transport factor 2 family protein n=1 Tax=Bordetella sp. H567 TaxID=1697043 RepID=UPI00081C6AC3|nr:nuclear transport factor 2 family protein [Bordetella sp. H567]AOB32807.1 hypothetical protein AKI39_21795 [Bordetella sp. H567]
MNVPTESQAQQLIEQQLTDYNNRDIDAYMRHWSPDCQNFEFPDKLLAEGAEQIRARYTERFKDDALHARLVNRIVVDDLVVDQEVVTRTFPDGVGDIDVVAIYRVTAGKISHAWFKFGQVRMR